MGHGPHHDARRRHSDFGARYVRALLSHGLRRESGRLCRCVHGGDQLAKRRARLRRIASVSLYSRPRIRPAELRLGRVRATVAFRNALPALAREVTDQAAAPEDTTTIA